MPPRRNARSASSHPLQRVGDEAAEYFYESMATRSAHYLQALLNELGGTRYQIVDYRFGKGVRQYDGYASYRRLRVQALDPAGEPVQIAAPPTGTLRNLSPHPYLDVTPKPGLNFLSA